VTDAWLSSFNTTPVIELVRSSLESDTFRGGAQIIFVRNGMRDITRDRALTSLPAGWSSSGQVAFDSRGATLLSRTTPATLTTSDSDYTYFDVAVDVIPVSPQSSTGVLEEIACLEHDVGGEIARVCLVRGPATLYGIGEAFVGDLTAGAQSITGGVITLRMIRNGPRIYGYVGVRSRVEEYSVLLKVLDAPFAGVGGGVLRLASRSAITATAAIFSDFTVRSHATINGRPIVNKRSPTNRQLVGFVPAASIKELGLTEVSVFGLFGSVTDSSAFSYTLPAPRTVGNEITRTLRTYQDPTIRDGE
jgi:hypothetical protein